VHGVVITRQLEEGGKLADGPPSTPSYGRRPTQSARPQTGRRPILTGYTAWRRLHRWSGSARCFRWPEGFVGRPIAWSKSAIRAIVINPRYTGRQVWNKQRKREVLIDVHDVTLGHETKLAWNPRDKWVWSSEIVNPPIIDEETFKAAQELLAARGHGPTRHKPHRARHVYVLRGIVYCGICHRKMEGSWNNNAPYYRCRFPEKYALANKVQHPRNVYLREGALLPRLDAWLCRYFAPHRRAETVAMIAAAQGGASEDSTTVLAQQTIDECDRKLARYRAALDALDEGTDPAVIAE
jgi:site-specific DNA recombinase